MSKKKFSGSISGKGYYIALVLCAAAIGISGFLYYRNTETPDDTLHGSGAPTGGHEVVATDPSGATPTSPTPTNPSGNKKPFKTSAPVSGQTVAVYAMDSLAYNETTRDWRVHNGIDIAAEAGTKVCAAADGEVYSVYEDGAMGTTVTIRHENGYITKYASLEADVSVKPGDTVTMGQQIGTVGNTALLESAIGDHIHFSVTCNGTSVDPEAFLALS